MITHEMLDIYAAFDGDIDGYARVGSAQQRRLIDDAQWREIAALLHEVLLLDGGKVSASYAAQISQRLSTLAAGRSVEDRLRRMARESRGGQP